MLEAVHPAFDGTRNRLIGVEMRRDIGAGVARLLDDGADLLAREAEEVDRVGRRGDAAIGHDLDEIGAVLDLLARRAAHLVHPVADPAHRAELPVRLGPVLVAAAEISVSAGLRERLAGEVEARGIEQPLVSRHPERVGRPAHVAHGGEAAHQHPMHDLGRAMRHQRIGQRRVDAEVGVAGHDMNMRIDQPRHQRPPAEIKGLRCGGGDGGAHLADHPPLHEHGGGVGRRGG